MLNRALISLLVFASLCFTCSGQPEAPLSGLRADLYVLRIPVVQEGPLTCGFERVLIVLGEDRFGLLTQDSVVLPLLKVKHREYLEDQRNGDRYTVNIMVNDQEGFIIFVTPIVKDAPNASTAFVLSTENICN